jgi:16S rRNA G527 N7-methylase RsmG
VLALLRPEVPATLLEPRARRWAFLREACRAAGRAEIEVLRDRHDRYAGPPAPTVTIRALALPLRDLAPLVAPGGRVLAFGAAPAPERGWEPGASPRPADLHVWRRQ